MNCGDCTLCCDLFPIEELDKAANEKCKFCDKGCTIHGDHPKACKEFECMYVQMENIPVELRPDKCHVIFEKMSDDRILGTLDARYDLTDIANRQISSFLKQGFEVKLGASDYRKPMIWQPMEQT
jgi:hypothetical protein